MHYLILYFFFRRLSPRCNRIYCIILQFSLSGRCMAISKMNTRWFNNILCYNYIKIFIFHIKEHNNEISPQPSASFVLTNGDPEPTTTSSDKSLPDSPQPSTSRMQSGSGRPSNHELGYSLQPRRAYDEVKFGIKGTDYTIVLNKRKYSTLSAIS